MLARSNAHGMDALMADVLGIGVGCCCWCCNWCWSWRMRCEDSLPNWCTLRCSISTSCLTCDRPPNHQADGSDFVLRCYVLSRVFKYLLVDQEPILNLNKVVTRRFLCLWEHVYRPVKNGQIQDTN